MNVIKNSRIAISYMVKRPMRTLLVLQGIIWAVAVGIFPNSIHEGIKDRAAKRPSEYGLDTITLHAQARSFESSLSGDEALFTMDDLDALKREFSSKGLIDATPAKVVKGYLKLSGKEAAAEFVGTDEHTPTVRTFYPAKGRYISANDVAKKRKVCVLESKVAQNLFNGQNPVGKTVKASFDGKEELELEVIGVMQKRDEERLSTNEFGFRYKTKQQVVGKLMYMMGLRGDSTEWKRTETCAHIPIALMDGDDYSWIIVKTPPAGATDFAKELQTFLISRGKEAKALTNIFLPIVMEKRIKTEGELFQAIFLVCLILGGVMIMNIMLLSVVERYREIAIRRVEGATKKDIVLQFLTEGAVLCVVATIFGIPLGLLMGYVAAKAEPWALASVGIPYKRIPICVLWAVGIGLISAILPARKAASLDPVEILRNE